MKKLILLCALVLTGCSKTSDELLGSLCIEGLKNNLQQYALYDGWSMQNARIVSIEMAPNEAHSAFMDVEVFIDNFTVKNGFNTDVRSVAVCSGIVIPSSDDNSEYVPLYYKNIGKEHAVRSLRFTLNDKPLGL